MDDAIYTKIRCQTAKTCRGIKEWIICTARHGAYFPVWTDSEEVLVSGMGGTLVKHS